MHFTGKVIVIYLILKHFYNELSNSAKENLIQ